MTIEFPSEIKTQEDGLRALKALVAHARASAQASDSNEARFRDLDQAVADMRASVQAFSTRRTSAPLSGADRAIEARYTKALNPNSVQSLGGQLLGESTLIRGFETPSGLFVAGLLDDVPTTDAQAELQQWVERRSVIRAFQRGMSAHRAPHTPRCDEMIERLGRAMPGAIGKAFADAAGSGAEWIPDDMYSSIERDAVYDRAVAGLFAEVPVSTETTLLPYLGGNFIPYIAGEITGDDPAQYKSSSLSTAQRSVSVKTLAVRCQVSENAAEDALLNAMDSVIRPEGVAALAAGLEDGIINGDTGTHQDTGLGTWNPDDYYSAAPGGSSIDHRRAWVGLRARAFDASSATDRSTFDFSTFSADSAALKGPKNGPRDKVVIANGKVIATQFLAMTQLVTVDKYGAAATIVSGEVARIAGIPVIESQFLTDDLNVSGIYDGVTTTKGGYLTVSRSRFRRYVRRGISIEIAKDVSRGLFNCVWKQRLFFKTVDAAATKNVHFSYNMS